MGTKKPQELNQQLNLKPGTKSSASGTKLLTLNYGRGCGAVGRVVASEIHGSNPDSGTVSNVYICRLLSRNTVRNFFAGTG